MICIYIYIYDWPGRREPKKGSAQKRSRLSHAGITSKATQE